MAAELEDVIDALGPLIKDEEVDHEDEELFCGVSIVDIKALETSCALAGGGSLRAQPPRRAAVKTAPSSPSECLDTFSLDAATLTGHVRASGPLRGIPASGWCEPDSESQAAVDNSDIAPGKSSEAPFDGVLAHQHPELLLQELTDLGSASALAHIGTAHHADQRSSDLNSPDGPAARLCATAQVANEPNSSPALQLPCSTGSEGSACIGMRTSRRLRRCNLQAIRDRPGSSDSKSSSPAADPATPTSAMSVDSLMPHGSMKPEGSPACGSRRNHKRAARGTALSRSGTLRGGSSGVPRGTQGTGNACSERGCIRTPVWRAGPHGVLCNACGVRWMKFKPR